MNIAVIIPFYQTTAGILARALASIFAQTLAGARIDVIVVDDASPLDPAGDVAACGAPPAGLSVRVVQRPNGGPGAARNTGLGAVAATCDFVAFLDSDDEWTRDHLARAVAALGEEGDFYFTNHQRGGGAASDLDRSRFLKSARASERRVVAGADVITRAGSEVADFIVDEYLAHTSSIVIRASRLGSARYEEKLRSAGEDHLFSLDLALGARKVCVSLASEVVRGTGVSIYDNAQEWGSAPDFRRRTFNIAGLKFMRARAPWPAATRKRMGKRLRGMRGAVAFVLLSRTLKGARLDVGLLSRLDPVTIWMAPYFAAAFMTDKSLRDA